MFSLSQALLVFAVPAGATAGLCAWCMALGGAGPLEGLRTPPFTQPLRDTGRLSLADDLMKASSAPLFPLTEGPGATPEPQVALQGLVRSPKRTAALISLNGQPAQWIAEGESLDGARLAAVGRSDVRLDLPTRYLTVNLDQAGAPAAPARTAPGPAPQR